MMLRRKFRQNTDFKELTGKILETKILSSDGLEIEDSRVVASAAIVQYQLLAIG
jgi:hypothetical protein